MGSEAWQRAHDAADAAGVTLRALEDSRTPTGSST
jgi:hypothetical protein